jgi:hypothetical protein
VPRTSSLPERLRLYSRRETRRVKSRRTTRRSTIRQVGIRKEIQTCLDAANDAVNEVLARQARIYLFGDESPAGIAAAGVASHLRSVMFALEHRPDSIRDHDAMSRYDQNVTRTREQHEKFNRAARGACTETRWGRFQRWSVKWL